MSGSHHNPGILKDVPISARDAARTTRWDSLVALASVAAAAGLVAFIAVMSRRGFELTDKGFYLLTSSYPQDVVATMRGFERCLRRLVSDAGRTRTATISSCAALCVGGLLYYHTRNRTPTYNLLAIWCRRSDPTYTGSR